MLMKNQADKILPGGQKFSTQSLKIFILFQGAKGDKTNHGWEYILLTVTCVPLK